MVQDRQLIWNKSIFSASLPRRKKRKRKNCRGRIIVTRKNYDPKDLEEAVRCVQLGLMTASRASIVYGVPSRTIYFRLNRTKDQCDPFRCKDYKNEESPIKTLMTSGNVSVDEGIESQSLSHSEVKTEAETCEEEHSLQRRLDSYWCWIRIRTYFSYDFHLVLTILQYLRCGHT